MTIRAFPLTTLLLGAGLLSALFAMPQGLPNGQVSSGVIQGVVTRRGTNTPISDVRVSLSPPRTTPNGTGPTPVPQPLQSTVTDGAGRFTFVGVAVGTVRVRAQLEGYFGPIIAGEYAAFAATDVTVAADRPTSMTIPLIPAGTINGRITNPVGRPLPNATVQLLRLGYEEGVATLSAMETQRTDDRGEYRLHSLPPGRYYLSANPPSPTDVLPGNVSPDTREIRVQTFYPNASDPTSATPITLDDGAELRSMDIRIATAMTGTITGKLASILPPGPVDNPARGPREPTPVFSITRVDAPMTTDRSVASGIQSEPDGSFKVSQLLPGVYDILVRQPIAANMGWGPLAPPARAPGPFAWGRTRVEVRGGADVQGVSVVVHKGFDLKGRLVVDGRPTRADVQISLNADPTNSTSDEVVQRIFQQISAFRPTIEPDGSFLIPLLSDGKYRFQITLPGAATAYVADIQQAGFSVYDNGLTVGNSEILPVDVIVNTNGGSVQGTVVGSDQKPINAAVVLVPQPNRRQNGALYKRTRSDAQGRFQLDSIPPGQYKVFSWINLQNSIWQNPEFLARYEQYGVPVTISAGARASVNVTMAPDNR